MINRTRPVGVRLPRGTKVRSLAGGCWHSMALTAAGRVLAWGNNGDAELGDGTTTNRRSPVRVKIPSGNKVTALGGGCLFSMARTASGRVLTWGFNGAGQLGDGRTRNSTVPVRAKLPAGVTAFAIGTGPPADFAFALVRL